MLEIAWLCAFSKRNKPLQSRNSKILTVTLWHPSYIEAHYREYYLLCSIQYILELLAMILCIVTVSCCMLVLYKVIMLMVLVSHNRGSNPRHHIWTIAGALDDPGASYVCTCIATAYYTNIITQ